MSKIIKFSVLLMLFIMLPANVSNAATLTDIAGSDNRTAIEYLYNHNVISGYPDGTFRWTNTINRAELLKILVGAKGVKPTLEQHKNCFPDVKEEWFAPYVCYAKAQGWVQGYADNTFRPSRSINKVEAIKMLVNSQSYSMEKSPVETPQFFSDIETASWYYPFLRAAYEKGLLEQEGGNYGIGALITRGEISENLYRAMFIHTYDFKSFSDFSDHYEEYVAWVKTVIDGDTLEIWMTGDQIEKVRLIGIDSPEIGQNQCYSQEAKQVLEKLASGATIIMKSDPTQAGKDLYGRLLRYVYLPEKNDLSLNKWMLEQGLAFEYTYEKPYLYQSEFQNAEASAQSAQAGLWAENTCNGQPGESTNAVTYYKFYVSSQAKTKYYCETDSAWENLSPANLLIYQSEAELKTDFPNLILNQPC